MQEFRQYCFRSSGVQEFRSSDNTVLGVREFRSCRSSDNTVKGLVFYFPATGVPMSVALVEEVIFTRTKSPGL